MPFLRRALRCGGLLLLLLVFPPPGPAGAQAPEPPEAGPTGGISGRVLDAETLAGIAGARVQLVDAGLSAVLTDENGRFRISGVPTGIQEVEFQHLAYGRGTELVLVHEGPPVQLEARLAASPIALDSMVIEVEVRPNRLVQVGFYERQRRGWGHHFSGSDAESWRLPHTLLRVPGVHLRQGRSAFDRRVVFRRAMNECTPTIYLDRIEQRWAGGNIEDVVGGMEVAAVEVYRGHDVPGEFMTRDYPPCGVILLWSAR